MKKEQIIDVLKTMYPRVENRMVEKNGVMKDAIIIFPERNSQLGATVYVDQFESYSPEDAARYISDMLKETPNIAIDSLSNWDYCKDKISVAVRKTGESDAIKWRVNNDIDAYVRLFLGDGKSAVVKEGLIDKWGVSREDIICKAIENMRESIVIQDMNEMLFAMMEGKDSDSLTLKEFGSEPQPAEFYCVTNKEKMHGAGIIADHESLMEIHNGIGNFYIIPSSIHEILIVPESMATAIDLKTMIREVNEAEVAPEEQLGNRPILFKGESLN